MEDQGSSLTTTESRVFDPNSLTTIWDNLDNSDNQGSRVHRNAGLQDDQGSPKRRKTEKPKEDYESEDIKITDQYTDEDSKDSEEAKMVSKKMLQEALMNLDLAEIEVMQTSMKFLYYVSLDTWYDKFFLEQNVEKYIVRAMRSAPNSIAVQGYGLGVLANTLPNTEIRKNFFSLDDMEGFDAVIAAMLNFSQSNKPAKSTSTSTRKPEEFFDSQIQILGCKCLANMIETTLEPLSSFEIWRLLSVTCVSGTLFPGDPKVMKQCLRVFENVGKHDPEYWSSIGLMGGISVTMLFLQNCMLSLHFCESFEALSKENPDMIQRLTSILKIWKNLAVFLCNQDYFARGNCISRLVELWKLILKRGSSQDETTTIGFLQTNVFPTLLEITRKHTENQEQLEKIMDSKTGMTQYHKWLSTLSSV